MSDTKNNLIGRQDAIQKLRELFDTTLDADLSSTARGLVCTVSAYAQKTIADLPPASSDAERRLARLRERAQALVDRLRECEPHINAAFVMQHIHGMRYSGPGYGVELKELQALLDASEQETT